VSDAPTTESVAEAQSRLARLGHDPAGDAPGALGPHTRIALQAFQRQRGLPITGLLDDETRTRLVEAGWSLGRRLLFLSRPHQRGDDVAALQEALALLGFDPGRIDGIFGSLTEHALEEFQRNCDLDVSGVLTRASLDELRRMSSHLASRHLVTSARDASGVATRPRVVVVAGPGGAADRLASALESHVRVLRATGDDVQQAAQLANGHGAGLLVFLEGRDADGPATLHYFESYQTHSVAGQQLVDRARAWLEARGRRATTSGMSLPILRETTMPAVTAAEGEGVPASELAEALRVAVLEFFDTSR
jgi:N-acetylmuramoyl-L-alanine amidase